MNCCDRALQDEYDQLRRALGEQKETKSEDSAAAAAGDTAQMNGDVDVLSEARLLRQHKGRLEARMRVLEEHNEQLDSQLKRLRQLLHDSEQARQYRALHDSSSVNLPSVWRLNEYSRPNNETEADPAFLGACRYNEKFGIPWASSEII